jgi:hypothetical protein
MVVGSSWRNTDLTLLERVQGRPAKQVLSSPARWKLSIANIVAHMATPMILSHPPSGEIPVTREVIVCCHPERELKQMFHGKVSTWGRLLSALLPKSHRGRKKFRVSQARDDC